MNSRFHSISNLLPSCMAVKHTVQKLLKPVRKMYHIQKREKMPEHSHELVNLASISEE